MTHCMSCRNTASSTTVGQSGPALSAWLMSR